MPLIDDVPVDLAELKSAVALLESTSLTLQIANLVGKPIELLLDKLPAGATRSIQAAVHAALQKSVDAALWSLGDTAVQDASNKTHLGLSALSGAFGGFFGMAGTLVELPVSTTLMMRSVADIARSQGLDLNDPLVKAECIQVFALGGPSADDDAAESAYYGIRNAMVAVAHEVGKGLADVAARQAAAAAAGAATRSAGFTGLGPKEVGGWLVKLIEAVATRFGVQVTEKIAAQAVPVLGAISGATINSMFMRHFQDMATGHFTVLRLEQRYGPEAVQAHYLAIRAQLQAKA